MKTKTLLIFALLFAAHSFAQVVVPDVAVTAPVGKQIDFAVTADGAAPISFQWQKDATNIVGATASTFSVASAKLTDAGTYVAIISNSAGSITSPKAIISVVAPPVITVQPKTLTALVGSKPSFSVTATGTGPFTYQWKKDGVNYPASNPTAITATFVNPGADAGDAGMYTCVITNAGGSVTSAAAALVVVQVTLPSVLTFSATVK